MTNNRDKLKKVYPEIAKAYERVSMEQYELLRARCQTMVKEISLLDPNLDTEEEVHVAMTGLWFRINDKINRLKQLVLLNKKQM